MNKHATEQTSGLHGYRFSTCIRPGNHQYQVTFVQIKIKWNNLLITMGNHQPGMKALYNAK